MSARDVAEVMERVGDTPVDLRIRTGGGRAFGPTETPAAIIDLLSDQTALGEGIAEMLPEFALAASEVDGLGRCHLWGPDLISPTERTRIHPDVLTGEPYVEGTRIPTVALYALTTRGLEADRIAELYDIQSMAAADAIWLERSVRAGKRLPVAA